MGLPKPASARSAREAFAVSPSTLALNLFGFATARRVNGTVRGRRTRQPGSAGGRSTRLKGRVIRFSLFAARLALPRRSPLILGRLGLPGRFPRDLLLAFQLPPRSPARR